MILGKWLSGLIDYARESWAELRLEEQRAKETELDRLHPMLGPRTQTQAMLERIWLPEISRQLSFSALPVLWFEQFAVPSGENDDSP